SGATARRASASMGSQRPVAPFRLWPPRGSRSGPSVTTGTGCYVTSTSGYALRTDGKVRLDKSAGLATVAGGTSAIAVTPGIDLTTTSAVIATLNGNAGGS